MKTNTSVNLPRLLSWLCAIIIMLVPFHAFLTVWLSSGLGHYTALRLWKEFLLAIIATGAVWVVWRDKSVRQKLFSQWLVRLMLAYILLLIICASAGLISHSVTAKAMWYGLLVDSRFLIFFLAVMVISAKDDWLAENWRNILLIPAIIVAAFAILQYLLLPRDFLKHFGYGDKTISPYETINHNLAHLRVASTLRGANPLGAYLLIPISAMVVSFFKEKRQRLNIFMIGFGLVLALVFSFSRSAWVGAIFTAAAIIQLGIDNRKLKIIFTSIAGLLVISIAGLVIGLRHNTGVESVLLHNDKVNNSETSSNQGHSAALKSAAKDIVRQPLGGGVGSAGPQSVYNDNKGRVAEDYYLQIGQEAGLLGMALFIAIIISLGKLLYTARAEPLAVILLASLVGLSLVNLLSHAWSDDTLAYVWWGLAGICLAPAILTVKPKQKNAKKIKTA